MASDIDIEEHNVLDHPRIRGLFPDLLASIKVELDSDDEDVTKNEELDYLESQVNQEQDDVDEDNIHLIDTSNVHEVASNKIILGSIPPQSEKDPLTAHVLLKDWKYILNRHPFYCRDCFILFPTQNTIDAHKMATHSLLVAVNKPTEDILQPPSVESVVVTDNRVVKNTAMKSTAKNATDGAEDWIVCPICKCCYKTPKYIEMHMSTQHCTGQLTPLIQKFIGNCAMCYFKTKSVRAFNSHVQMKHSQLFQMPYAQYLKARGKKDPRAGNTALGPVTATVTPVKKGGKSYRPVPRNALYFCTACKLYGHNRSTFHTEGKCQRVANLQKTICKMCGLSFSVKSYKPHLRREHKKNNLKLADMVFYDVCTERIMMPQLPEWKKCVECNINFFGYVALKRHQCFEEKFKRCGICGEGFSDLAYKLHYNFHKYVIPDGGETKPDAARLDVTGGIRDANTTELMKRYQSMETIWNIIYLCQFCEIVFDNYDNVVEHSQNHFCKSISHEVDTETCTTCDLNFERISYEKHQAIHLNRIKRNSFKILRFNYKDLLNEKWFDIFDVISKEQKEHILSRSVYNLERRVRLYLEVDGATEHTLFKCNVCDALVTSGLVVEHAALKDACANVKERYKCRLCDLTFFNNSSVLNHKRDHAKASPLYRILRFNERSDFALNVLLCHISKQMSRMKSGREFETITNSSTHKEIDIKVDAKTRLFDVFKCYLCKKAVFTRNGMLTHKCISHSLTKCRLCNLYVLNINKHMSVHKRLPAFSKNTVNVILFNQNDALIGPAQLKFYQCQMCKLCVMYNSGTKTHKCTTNPNRVTRCDICNVLFKKPDYPAHFKIHEREPHLVASDFKIFKFNTNNETIASGHQIEADATKDDATHTTFVVYKCMCNSLFLNRDNLIAHAKSCTKTSAPTSECESCGLKFSTEDMIYHKENHQLCDRVHSVLVGTVEINKDGTEATDHWIFMCSPCRIYFMTTEDLTKHFDSNHEKEQLGSCRTCRIVLPFWQYKRHMSIHHDEMQYTVSNLNKVTFDVVTTASLKQQMSRENAARNSLVTDRKILYKCVECSLHFSCLKTLKYHYERSQHDIKRFTCRYCGLHFTQILIVRHEQTRHTIDDFDIIVHGNKAADPLPNDFERPDRASRQNQPLLVETTLPTPVKVMSTTTTTSPIKKADETVSTSHPSFQLSAYDRKRILRKVTQTHKELLRIIYQCGLCAANFLNESTLESHVRAVKHDSKLYECLKCGLQFNGGMMRRHEYMHHTLLKFQRDDLVVKVFNVSVGDVASNTVTRSKATSTGSDETVRRETSLNSLETSTPVACTSTSDEHDLPKLFRCAPCDVYYTSAALCREHCADHARLDATEYIACKVCDLQFICECIGTHMRGHREDTFDIDKIEIIEFQPRPGRDPEITAHRASDRLKPKPISTTTDI